jgi:cytochrome c oxidase assembly factor CtaG
MPELASAVGFSDESPQSRNVEPSSPFWRAGRSWFAAVLLIPMAFVVAGTVMIGRSGYDATSIGYPGLTTSLSSAILRVIVELSSVVTVGGLFFAVFTRARRGADRLMVRGASDMRIVRWSALIWLVGAVALVPVDAADANGAPLAKLLTPGALGYLVSASYIPAAWVFVVVVAGIVCLIVNFVQTWQVTLLAFGLSVLALLAPVVVAQVLVGPNHDWGGDAAIFGTPAAAVLFGTTFTYLSRRGMGPQPYRATTLRFLRVAIVCWGIIVGSDVIITLFEIAGRPVLSTPTGVLFLVRFLLLAGVVPIGYIAWRRLRRDVTATAISRTLIVSALMLLAGNLGVAVLMTRIPPPVFFVSTSIAQNFLGFNVTATPTLAVFLFDWRINILFIVISAVGIGLYLFGVVRLRRRGDKWNPGRTIAWILGWLVVVLTTSSGLGRYSGASFSAHMVLHMSLNMLVPVLLVLGGPITLALRASTPKPSNQAAGVHEWLTALLNWKLTRNLYNPLVVFVSFIGSYYVLYFTDIFYQAMRYHWAHQLLDIHFIFVGYLFYSLVIGVDLPPRPLPHIGKLGLVLAAMPFHAFFGVIVMTSDTVIAKLFYQYLNEPWMTNLKADQYLGGGIAWSAGELPLIVVVVALVTQWAKQDSRVAARTDRHLDAGLDDSFDVYNAMLTGLAQRREVRPGAPAPSSRTDDHEH